MPPDVLSELIAEKDLPDARQRLLASAEEIFAEPEHLRDGFGSEFHRCGTLARGKKWR